MATTVNRDNEQWVQDLSSDGEVQSAALQDLRTLLLRGLKKGIGGRAGNDESFLEDATQDALLAIVQKLDQFQYRSQFTTWAVSIAVRTAISALRRKHWQDVSLGSFVSDDERRGVPEPAADESTSIVDIDERGQMLSALRTAIETDLSEKQRTALLAEMKGMPMQQIADEMGSNRNAIYKLTHDARKKLKQALKGRGFSADQLMGAFA